MPSAWMPSVASPARIISPIATANPPTAVRKTSAATSATAAAVARCAPPARVRPLGAARANAVRPPARRAAATAMAIRTTTQPTAVAKPISRPASTAVEPVARCAASPGGEPQCSAGTCSIKTCSPGFADCTGGYADGCETKTSTDLANCGACGKACTTTNGSPVCVAGACQVKTCTGTFADCNGMGSDGCETNTATSSTHCGACTGSGVNCDAVFDNASGQCTNSVCTLKTCATGYSNCDTSVLNGCEANLQTDEVHCGACTTACSKAGATSNDCNVRQVHADLQWDPAQLRRKPTERLCDRRRDRRQQLRRLRIRSASTLGRPRGRGGNHCMAGVCEPELREPV